MKAVLFPNRFFSLATRRRGSPSLALLSDGQHRFAFSFRNVVAVRLAFVLVLVLVVFLLVLDVFDQVLPGFSQPQLGHVDDPIHEFFAPLPLLSSIVLGLFVQADPSLGFLGIGLVL